MNIEKSLTNKIIGALYDDIIKYYGLYGFIKYKIQALKEKPILINSNEDFWSLILKDEFNGEYDKNRKLLSGQTLKFSNNFYLSEWAPKIPGKLWTKTGSNALNSLSEHRIDDNFWVWYSRYEVILDEFGKKKAMEAGYGSVRINPSNNPNESFMYMSLTTPENWEVDLGIPVVVSKRVFEEFRKKSENNGAVEIGKLEGILIKDLEMPLNIVSSAIGAELNQKTVDILTKQTSLPRCFVYVPSTLGIDFKYNNSHPECTAWTMYNKKPYNGRFIWRKTFNQKDDSEFGMTYSHFNPTKPESITEAVSFLKDYAGYNDGSELITDFDGIEPKLESRLKINNNPATNQTQTFTQILKEMYQWSKSIE